MPRMYVNPNRPNRYEAKMKTKEKLEKLADARLGYFRPAYRVDRYGWYTDKPEETLYVKKVCKAAAQGNPSSGETTGRSEGLPEILATAVHIRRSISGENEMQTNILMINPETDGAIPMPCTIEDAGSKIQLRIGGTKGVVIAVDKEVLENIIRDN